MNPLRLLRTLRHLTADQLTARVRHELWLRTRAQVGWPRDAGGARGSARLASVRLEPPTGAKAARLRAIAERWRRGRVDYVGLEGDRSDWLGEGRPKLWRYERHYHDELVALAACAQSEPGGPWVQLGQALQDDWARATPPFLGDAWEPYPTARRILSWAEAFALEPRIAGPAAAQRLALQLEHLAAHLERHLLGNHLLCDAAALVAGAAILEERAPGGGTSGTSPLLAMGAALLDAELERQLLADGGYAERTVQYHALVLQDLSLARSLAATRGHTLRCAPGLDEMREWLVDTRRSDGSWPLANDAVPASQAIARELIEGRSSQQRAASGPTSLRDAGSTSAPDTGGTSAPGTGWTSLTDTGWSFLRAGESELFIDSGLIGPPEQPGHGHDDALSYELTWHGEPLIADTGVSTYERGAVRDFERSARAHATVSVGGLGIDEVWASFRVGARGRVDPLETAWLEGKAGFAHGRARSFRGFLHARHWLFWPGQGLLVADRVTRARGEILSHIPLGTAWSAREESGAIALTSQGGQRLRLLLVRGTLASIARGSDAPRDGWISEGFHRAVPRTSITLRADARGSCAYAILVPGATAESLPGELRLHTSSGTICAPLPPTRR